MLYICFFSRQGSLWTRLNLETCIKPGKISNIIYIVKIPKLVIYTWGQFVPVLCLACLLFLDWWMLNALSFFKTMNAFNMHNLQRGYSWNVVELIIAYNQISLFYKKKKLILCVNILCKVFSIACYRTCLSGWMKRDFLICVPLLEYVA